MIRVGVIGYGYWGPNVARNFNHAGVSEVVAISDKRSDCLNRAKQAFPQVNVTKDSPGILTSPDIDVVAVVTPVWTHYELAKTALKNGKHVFVEKPFTANTAQAEELIELAAKKKLQIMVDHTFLFTGAVRKIRQLVDEGVMGNLFYYDSMRVNLGLFQHDINVIWDLAPHDLSIMDYLIQKQPEAIVATGEKHLNSHVDIAFLTIYFPGQCDRPHQRQLAFSGQSADHADRRREEDAGMERSGGRRKNQSLRQRRDGQERQQGALRSAGELPLRRHVGAAGRADRGPKLRNQPLHGMHLFEPRCLSTTAWPACAWCACWKRRKRRLKNAASW